MADERTDCLGRRDIVSRSTESEPCRRSDANSDINRFGAPIKLQPPFCGHQWLPHLENGLDRVRRRQRLPTLITEETLVRNDPGRWHWTARASHSAAQSAREVGRGYGVVDGRYNKNEERYDRLRGPGTDSFMGAVMWGRSAEYCARCTNGGRLEDTNKYTSWETCSCRWSCNRGGLEQHLTRLD